MHPADQIVRARDLKPGQMVGLNLGTTYQSMTPIGGATATKSTKLDRLA